MLQYVIAGLTVGSTYSLLGLGIVITYRSTNVLNFAQGELAMVMAFICYYFLVGLGLQLFPAIFLTMIAGVVLGAAVYNLFIFPNRTRDHEGLALISLGMKLAIVGLVAYLIGVNDRVFPNLFSSSSMKIGSVYISQSQIVTISISLVVMLAFAVFLRFTKLGLAMRAVAENVGVSELLGINPRLIGSLAWVMATWLGAVTGILLADAYSLSPYMLGFAVLKGFAAIVVGGMTSIYGVMVAGLLIGILEAAVSYFIDPVFQDTASLILVIIILLVRPQGLFGQREIWRA